MFHLFKGVEPDDSELEAINRALTSPEWDYKLERINDGGYLRLKYDKTIPYE